MVPNPRLTLALASLVLLAPLMTWRTLRASPLPWDSPFLVVPLWWVQALGLAVVAVWIILPADPWLGLFCVWSALSGLWHDPWSVAVATWIVLGGVLVILFATVDPRITRRLLLTIGLLQALLVLAQSLGTILPWGTWATAPFTHGTYGSPKYAAMALAMITPLAPWLLVPLFAVALILTHSYIAIAAAGAALALRIPRAWPLVLAIAAVSLYLSRYFSWDSLHSRTWLWSRALTDWWHGGPLVWVTGYGAGSWFQRLMPERYHGELYLAPYNDYLQLLYESGLVGVTLAGAWVASHWRGFVAEPSLVAVALLAAVWFPFHLASVAIIALALIGSAERRAPLCGTSWRGPSSPPWSGSPLTV